MPFSIPFWSKTNDSQANVQYNSSPYSRPTGSEETGGTARLPIYAPSMPLHDIDPGYDNHPDSSKTQSKEAEACLPHLANVNTESGEKAKRKKCTTCKIVSMILAFLVAFVIGWAIMYAIKQMADKLGPDSKVKGAGAGVTPMGPSGSWPSTTTITTNRHTLMINPDATDI